MGNSRLASISRSSIFLIIILITNFNYIKNLTNNFIIVLKKYLTIKKRLFFKLTIINNLKKYVNSANF